MVIFGVLDLVHDDTRELDELLDVLRGLLVEVRVAAVDQDVRHPLDLFNGNGVRQGGFKQREAQVSLRGLALLNGQGVFLSSDLSRAAMMLESFFANRDGFGIRLDGGA